MGNFWIAQFDSSSSSPSSTRPSSPVCLHQHQPVHPSVKSDVYSFGVVLLEMLSGMRAFEVIVESGQQNLADCIDPYLSDWSEVLSRVMDRRLEGQYLFKGAVQAAQLILECLRTVPRNRPSMTEVVEALELIQAKKHDESLWSFEYWNWKYYNDVSGESNLQI